MLKCSIHSQDWFPEQWCNVCVGWSLKQVKDLILEFLISGNLFSEKNRLDYYTILLLSFPLDECVDEVVYSEANCRWYRYDAHFLRWNTFAIIHSVDAEEVCSIIIRTFFYAYSLIHFSVQS